MGCGEAAAALGVMEKSGHDGMPDGVEGKVVALVVGVAGGVEIGAAAAGGVFSDGINM